MKMILKVLMLTLALSFSILANGFTINGKIKDQKGEIIPYVGIYVKNSTYGAVSNLKGEFSIHLNTGSYTIVFESLGYKKLEKSVVINNKDIFLEVMMNEEASTFEEIVFSNDKKERAKQIIQKVRANRKIYLSNVSSYKCNFYSKTSIEYGNPMLETGPDTSSLTKEKVNFVESYSELYFKTPNRFKQQVLAYKDLTKKKNSQASSSVSFSFSSSNGNAYQAQSTQSNPLLFEPNRSTADFNIYRNVLKISAFDENPFISPIGNAANLAYTYYLDGSFYENDTKIFIVKVKPRNPISNTLTGVLFVEDKTFAVVGARLDFPPSSLNFYKKFSIIQEYEKKDSTYLLTKEEFVYHARMGRKYAYGNTMVLYSNYKLDTNISSAFMRKGQLVYDDSSDSKTNNYWRRVRPVSLKAREISFIHVQDSIIKYETSDAYLKFQDSVTNYVRWENILLSGITRINRKKGITLYFNSLLNSVRPFAVGGYRHSIGGRIEKEWTKANRLNITYEVNYGFRNKDLKGQAKIGYTYLPKKMGSFYILGGDNYAFLNDYESIQATFSRSNYLHKKNFGFGGTYELTNGLLLDVGTQFSDFESIGELELAPWSEKLFGKINLPQDFIGYNELLLDVRLIFVPFQKYVLKKYKKLVLGSDYPTFNLHYKKGIKAFFGSDVNYDFLELNAKQELALGSFGVSKYEVFIGRFLNDEEIRIADKKFFRGSDRYFFSNPLNSFQLLGPTMVTTRAYFQGQYIHQFNGAIMNKVPLIKHLGIQALGGAGVLLVQDNNFKHVELYAGIAKPIKIRDFLFKVTAVYVTSKNSESKLNTGFKIGLDFFNSYTAKWTY